MDELGFEWDETKRQVNLAKHGWTSWEPCGFLTEPHWKLQTTGVLTEKIVLSPLE